MIKNAFERDHEILKIFKHEIDILVRIYNTIENESDPKERFQKTQYCIRIAYELLKHNEEFRKVYNGLCILIMEGDKSEILKYIPDNEYTICYDLIKKQGMYETMDNLITV